MPLTIITKTGLEQHQSCV